MSLINGTGVSTAEGMFQSVDNQLNNHILVGTIA